MELIDTLCKEDKLTVVSLVVDYKRCDRSKLSLDDVECVIKRNCIDVEACLEVFDDETATKYEVRLEELLNE